MGIYSSVTGQSYENTGAKASESVIEIGDHGIKRGDIFKATDTNVINPLNPGTWESIRTREVENKPRYVSKEELQAIKVEAKEKGEGANRSKSYYRKLAKIEASDVKVHKSHKEYLLDVSKCEIDKLRANSKLGKKLHGQRPQYTKMGVSVERAEEKANTRITELRAKLSAANK